jgi:hypothetical protein
MTRIIALFPLITLLFCLPCRGQEESVVLLQGRIVSAATGEAIGYATISLARNGIETMSNEEGRFIFKIPATDAGDSIFISHIGYQSVVLLLNGVDTGVKTIVLKERAVELPGVTVTPDKALDLIRKAIARIPDNYPSDPYVSHGFYRFVSWKDGKVVSLSEAIFNIYCPDDKRDHKQFRLIKARADRDEGVFRGSHITQGRSPEGLMDDDLVSHIHEAPVVGDEEIGKLDFTYNGLIDDAGKPAYEIQFDQKEGLEEALHKGRILIDSASLAFVAFDYSLSPKGLPYWKPERPGQPISQGLTMNISYRRYGGKYYLNLVHRDARWNHINLSGMVLENKSIYLVTRLDTGTLRRPKGKLIESKGAIELNVRKKAARQDNFWENYNSIEAEFNVDSVLRAMRLGN